MFTSDHGGNVRSNTPGPLEGHGPDERRRDDWLRWAGERPPTSNAPLRDGKGSLYEGGVRVPLIVAWPGRVEPGSRSATVVTTMDLYPTLLDLIGVPAREGEHFDGVSFAAVLRDSAASLDRVAIFNFLPHDNAALRPGVTVRRGDWKLMRRFDVGPGAPGYHELYDLRHDLGESTDRSADEPELVRELDALIDDFLADTEALVPIPNPDYTGPAESA